MKITEMFNHAPISARLGCENCGAELSAASFNLVVKQAEASGWFMRKCSNPGCYDWVEWFCPLCKPDFLP